MTTVYDGFNLIDPDTSRPWGPKEKQNWEDMADTVTQDTIQKQKDVSGHKHGRLYDSNGRVQINALSANNSVQVSQGINLAPGKLFTINNVPIGTVSGAGIVAASESSDHSISISLDTITHMADFKALGGGSGTIKGSADVNSVPVMTPDTTTIGTSPIKIPTSGIAAIPAQFSDENQSNFSVNQMQLSQLRGGAYFGRTGITENQLGLTDIGINWVDRGLSLSYENIAMSSDGKIQTAVVYNGYVYVSYDYGATWVQKGTSRNYFSVAMSSDGKIQTAVADYINVSSDYGATWAQKGTYGSYFSVAMSSDGRVQSACEANNLYMSYDYGNTWNLTTLSVYGGVYKGAISSDGMVITAHNGDGGSIYTSSDGGNTWVVHTSSIAYMESIAMSSDGRIQIINSRAVGVYASYDYGTTWTLKTSIIEYLVGIAISSNGQIQASVSQQYVHLSLDYGNTWNQVLTCSYAGVGVAMSSDGKIITCVESGSYIHTSYATSFVNGILQTQAVSKPGATKVNTANSGTDTVDANQYGAYSWRPTSANGTMIVTVLNGVQDMVMYVSIYPGTDPNHYIEIGGVFIAPGCPNGEAFAILRFDNGSWKAYSISFGA